MTDPQPLYALADPHQTIKLVVCYNPFDPSNRTEAELVWGHKRTLADYLDGLPDEIEWAVGVNGGVIDQKEWATKTLHFDDFIVLTPVPHGGGGGGGGGKSIFRLVGMIAIAALAAWAAPAIAAAATGLAVGSAAAAASTSFAIISAVSGALITGAGSMLMNMLMPAPQMDMNTPDVGSYGSGSGSKSSPTYGVDGPKNTSEEGMRVPVIYGEHRYGGNIAGIYVENEGNNQVLYIMQVLSEGEIENISDIRVNDQPVENFQDVDWRVRYGAPDQDLPPWFSRTVIPEPKGMHITHDEWVYHTTIREVDAIRLDFLLPAGLCYFTTTSSVPRANSVKLNVEYRRLGDENWLPFVGNHQWITDSSPTNDLTRGMRITVAAPNGSETAQTVSVEYRKVGDLDWLILDSAEIASTPLYEEYSGLTGWAGGSKTFIKTGLDPASYEVRVVGGSLTSLETYEPVSFTISDKSTSAVRRSLAVDELPEGYYEVRVQRASAETTNVRYRERVELSDVNEIIADGVAFRYSALLCSKIRVTDQIGQRPEITALIRGAKIKKFNYEGEITEVVWTNNPAWITIDILTKYYGADLPLSRLDIPAFVEWAEYCEQHGLVFNGAFDWNSNVWEAIQAVMRVGHAQISRAGLRYSVIMEAPAAPVMMFNVANIVEDSFEIEWLPLEDRANEIDLTYYDADNYYKRATVRVTSPDAIDSGRPRLPASITMIGVTSRAQAIREAWLHLQMNRLLHQKISFAAPLQAIGCVPGDVVLVQHDMPQWGFGGRIAEVISPTEILLDKDVTWDLDQPYRLLIHQNAKRRHIVTIDAINNNTIRVSGISVDEKIRRVLSGDQDLAVQGIYDADGSVDLALDTAAGLTVGQSVELWDTDIIVERDVDTSLSHDRTIILTAGEAGEAVAGANWLFGPVEKTAKPFRVLGISGSGDYEREINAIEYLEGIYEEPQSAVNVDYSLLPESIPPVENLTVSDSIRLMNGHIRTFVSVGWENPTSGLYNGCQVYVSTNGGPYALEKSFGSTTNFFEFEAEDQSTISIKVVSIGVLEGTMLFDSAPEVSHYVVGKYEVPSAPTNFTARRVNGGALLSWTKATDIDIVGYSIWANDILIADSHDSDQFRWENITDPGDYRFQIRTVDAVGLMSETITISLSIFKPTTVQEFEATQNGNAVVLTWEKNTVSELVQRYEIRRGVNWSAGDIIGTAHDDKIVVSLVPGNQNIFWIKAINDLGMYGETAAFARVDVVQPQTHNLIWSNSERTDGWTGAKLGFYVNVESDLVMQTDLARAEYVYDISLGRSVTGRVYIDDDPEAILTSMDIAWTEANFAWNSAQASTQWVDDGDVQSLVLKRKIAIEGALAPEEIEAFPLNGDPNGLLGTMPLLANNVTYQDGRFRQGALLTNTSQLSWDLTMPGVFSVIEWVRLNDQTGERVLLNLGDAGAASMMVVYDQVAQTMSLLADDGNDIILTNVELTAEMPVLLAVSQSATERTLRVGSADGPRTWSDTVTVAPQTISWLAAA